MDVIIDSLIEVAIFAINFISLFLIVLLIVWLFFRPLVISYHLTPDDKDIMLLSVYKLYHIGFNVRRIPQSKP